MLFPRKRNFRAVHITLGRTCKKDSPAVCEILNPLDLGVSLVQLSWTYVHVSMFWDSWPLRTGRRVSPPPCQRPKPRFLLCALRRPLSQAQWDSLLFKVSLGFTILKEQQQRQQQHPHLCHKRSPSKRQRWRWPLKQEGVGKGLHLERRRT